MSKTALVVDDSLMIRRMVSNSMKQAGFEVTEAANGKEGLKALEGRAFQIILTDINMPEMDGFDFIAGARAHAAHKFTPILVLTTEAEGKMIDRVKALGATGWIVKPFQPEKVMSVVNRVVP